MHVQGLLTQYAPVVLRGLYERDSRQAFCQPNLWTEPYTNLMTDLQGQQQRQQGGGMVATTAAVVQALLVQAGLTGEEEDSSTAPAVAMPVAGAAGGVPGLRTGALLLLLRCAPQCVPFNVRLELFRQMLEQDKVGGLGAYVW